MHWRPPIQRGRIEIRVKIVKCMLWNCPENVCIWHALVDLSFYGQSTNLHVRSQSGPKHATNVQRVWFLTFISRVSTNNIVMWELQHSSVDRDCFKTLTLQEILKNQNQLQVEHLANFKSHISSNKLDVQEGDVCVFQVNRIWDYIYRFAHGRNSRAWSLGFGHWCVTFKLKSKTEIQANTERSVVQQSIREENELTE